MTSGVKNGRAWDKATNIGEVSAATKIPPAEVVRLIDVCGHLLFVEREETKPMIAWIVFEDGE